MVDKIEEQIGEEQEVDLRRHMKDQPRFPLFEAIDAVDKCGLEALGDFVDPVQINKLKDELKAVYDQGMASIKESAFPETEGVPKLVSRFLDMLGTMAHTMKARKQVQEVLDRYDSEEEIFILMGVLLKRCFEDFDCHEPNLLDLEIGEVLGGTQDSRQALSGMRSALEALLKVTWHTFISKPKVSESEAFKRQRALSAATTGFTAIKVDEDLVFQANVTSSLDTMCAMYEVVSRLCDQVGDDVVASEVKKEVAMRSFPVIGEMMMGHKFFIGPFALKVLKSKERIPYSGVTSDCQGATDGEMSLYAPECFRLIDANGEETTDLTVARLDFTERAFDKLYVALLLGHGKIDPPSKTRGCPMPVKNVRYMWKMLCTTMCAIAQKLEDDGGS